MTGKNHLILAAVLALISAAVVSPPARAAGDCMDYTVVFGFVGMAPHYDTQGPDADREFKLDGREVGRWILYEVRENVARGRDNPLWGEHLGLPARDPQFVVSRGCEPHVRVEAKIDPYGEMKGRQDVMLKEIEIAVLEQQCGTIEVGGSSEDTCRSDGWRSSDNARVAAVSRDARDGRVGKTRNAAWMNGSTNALILHAVDPRLGGGRWRPIAAHRERAAQAAELYKDAYFQVQFVR